MKAKLVNGVLGILLVLALLLPGLPVSAADPVPANPATGTEGQIQEVGRVTLITGDVVTVTARSDGKRSFAISPADPNKLGQNFLTVEQGGKTYIIPSGIDLKKLDMELFNIDYLVDAGYGKEPSLPLMVTYSPQLTVPQVQSLEGKVTALGEGTKPLKEVQTLATRLAYTGISAAYANLVGQTEVEKIWLDRKIQAELSESVPLIGAPSFWNAGYRGQGQKIAILDTGIDSSHPALDDLDDNVTTSDPKVLVNVNFSDDVDFKDRHGHGTHVAGIAAGTGAAPVVPSPTHFWFSGEGNNLNNTLDHTFNLSTVASANLTFWTSYNTESGFDPGYLRISVDGGSTWSTLARYEGSSDGWKAKSYSLTPYVGGQVILRFQYQTDGSVVLPGWFIDSIGISEIGFSDNVESGPGTWVANGWTIREPGPGYTGVAPGANLWNVKVLNQYGSGYWSGIINGVNFASLGLDGVAGTGDEANVINMSIGGGGASDGTDPLSKAVNLAVERGVPVAVAAGNSGYGGLGTINVPGVAQKAITVGASTKSDTLAYFSSRGPTIDMRIKPDILAPGEYITSSVPGGQYQSWSGTSMATPLVTGAIALLRQAYGNDVPPRLLKEKLMFTAKDLGLNVYEQGAGRLNLQREPRVVVAVSPASKSLGIFLGGSLASSNFTFVNTDNVSHTVTLSANLTDVNSGIDYSGRVGTNYPNGFFLPASGSVNATLHIDIASLPASLFSGKLVATIDGGASRSIQAIFGFAKAWEVTLRKTDITGAPAAGHPLWVMMESPTEETILSWEETDASGSFSFPAFDGTYHVISPNWGQEKDMLTIWTVAENVTVSANTTVNLDERQTKVVDFNPNKPGMKPSGLVSKLLYRGYYSNSWSTMWYYPASFATRVSSIKRFDSASAYTYFPQAYFIPNDPSLVNSIEWYNLLFPVDNITDNLVISADYSKLVHRDTGYGNALQRERVEWYQEAWDYSYGGYVGFSYEMDAPQRRWEWLMPQPTMYYQELNGYTQNTGWGFFSSSLSYPPGDARWGIGIHPLTTGVNGYINWNVPPPPTPTVPQPVPQPSPPPGAGKKLNTVDQWNQLSINGPINRDALGNEFNSWPQGRYPGHLRVTQGSDNVIMEKDIRDYFWEYAYFQDSPQLMAEVWGWTPFGLSTRSYTRLDFSTNQSYYDHSPPQVTMKVTDINGFGIVPAGPVQVRVQATDSSQLNNVTLKYSVTDNASDGWTDAGAGAFVDGWYIFDLGQLDETFVHLAVNAEDQYGNRIYRFTNRAFYVGQSGQQVSINAPDTVPAGGNFTAMVGINQVSNFDAANYDVSYNPAVLRLINVTAGQINSGGNLTAIPVDMWSTNTTATGTVRIVQNVPGPNGASGTGYLAMLQFGVTGSVGQSSNITLTNGVLSDNLAQLIPASWIGDVVRVSVVRAGDATGDGLIDARDITKVERIIGRLDPPTPGADANQDGRTDALDITEVEIKIIHGS